MHLEKIKSNKFGNGLQWQTCQSNTFHIIISSVTSRHTSF